MAEVEQIYPKELDGLVSFWQYEGLVKKLILEAKMEFYFDQLKDFSAMSLELLDREEFLGFKTFLETKPVVVPVPLFKKLEKERGFNQANVIGKIVARAFRLEVKDVLVRVVDTGHRQGKSREDRFKRIHNAFEAREKFLNSVLLVDDVWITGTTMSACARVLKMVGVAKVWGIVLAR